MIIYRNRFFVGTAVLRSGILLLILHRMASHRAADNIQEQDAYVWDTYRYRAKSASDQTKRGSHAHTSEKIELFLHLIHVVVVVLHRLLVDVLKHLGSNACVDLAPVKVFVRGCLSPPTKPPHANTSPKNEEKG